MNSLQQAAKTYTGAFSGIRKLFVLNHSSLFHFQTMAKPQKKKAIKAVLESNAISVLEETTTSVQQTQPQRRSARLNPTSSNVVTKATITTITNTSTTTLVKKKQERKKRSKSSRGGTTEEEDDDDQARKKHKVTPPHAKDANKDQYRSMFVHEEEQEVHTLVSSDSSFLTVYTTTMCSLDVCKMGNAQDVSQYLTDIFQRLYKAEERFPMAPYIYKTPNLTAKKRYVLVDWLIATHLQFQETKDIASSTETLYLAIQIFDRFAAMDLIRNDTELYLSVATAYFIASKYEDITPPWVNELVKLTRRAFTYDDVIEMETVMLKALQYRITSPTPIHFLKRYFSLLQNEGSTTDLTLCTALYYLERALHVENCLLFRPSELALAAVCLAISHPQVVVKMGRLYDAGNMTALLMAYTTFSCHRIEQAAFVIVQEISSVPIVVEQSRTINSCHCKYSHQKYGRVSMRLSPPSVTQLAF